MWNVGYFILTENSYPEEHSDSQKNQVVCFPRTRINHVSAKVRGYVVKNRDPVKEKGSIVEHGLHISHTPCVLSPILKEQVRHPVKVFQLDICAYCRVSLLELIIQTNSDVRIVNQVLVVRGTDNTHNVANITNLVVNSDLSSKIRLLDRGHVWANDVAAHTAQQEKSLLNGFVLQDVF